MVSIIAGVTVAAAPESSVSFLATLTGIWFAVMGLFEVAGGLLLRRALSGR